MEPDLRQQFDLAVSADPGADAGEMAYAAIVEGGLIRRRRRIHRGVAGVAVGLVVVLGSVTGVNLLTGSPEPADQLTTVKAAMMPVAPSCSAKPVERDATDVLIFLATGVTDGQQKALDQALHDDAGVSAMTFETRQQAFERFRALWADHPDFVKSVQPKQLPESFRVRLADAAQFTAFRSRYAARAGVDEIVGRKCPASAPIGGVQ